MSERSRFLSQFLEYFQPVYKQLGLGEMPGFSYCSSIGKHVPETTEEELANAMMHRFKDIEAQEMYRKQTLLGPHRDDIVFLLNGVEVKKYASQGQLRTFLIAVKLALQRFISGMSGEKPLFLLDDLFSELDRKRVEKVLELLDGSGQSIITSTDKKEINCAYSISVEELMQ